jgi:hypothetical protein
MRGRFNESRSCAQPRYTCRSSGIISPSRLTLINHTTICGIWALCGGSTGTGRLLSRWSDKKTYFSLFPQRSGSECFLRSTTGPSFELASPLSLSSRCRDGRPYSPIIYLVIIPFMLSLGVLYAAESIPITKWCVGSGRSANDFMYFIHSNFESKLVDV